MGQLLDELYLPFSKEVLLQHFPRIKKKNEWIINEKNLDYYLNSIQRYHRYPKENLDGMPINQLVKPFQIQKDERFWTIQCLLSCFYSTSRTRILTNLLEKSYGTVPPFKGLSNWKELLDGKMDIVFEAPIPSTVVYGKKWLPENIRKVHFIPYVLHASKGKQRTLEGSTYVDAVLINTDNGFSVFFESKVLSDISTMITYDSRRNQIARNVDVMLKKDPSLAPPLNKRDPDKTLFCLLTPRMYQRTPSRLYWYKYHEYKNNYKALQNDLPHRTDVDFKDVVKKIGWLTWEDYHEQDDNFCPWLKHTLNSEEKNK